MINFFPMCCTTFLKKKNYVLRPRLVFGFLYRYPCHKDLNNDVTVSNQINPAVFVPNNINKLFNYILNGKCGHIYC